MDLGKAHEQIIVEVDIATVENEVAVLEGKWVEASDSGSHQVSAKYSLPGTETRGNKEGRISYQAD